MARPTTYRPEYCDILIKMRTEGKYISEFCVEVGISERTYQNWKSAHEDFREACEIADTASLAWNEALSRHIAKTNEGNANIHKHTLNNRFKQHYSERQEIRQVDGQGNDVLPGSIDVRQLARQFCAAIIEAVPPDPQQQTIDITPEKVETDEQT